MIKTFKVGLTGGIGSGKSTVLSLISKKRVPVLQTDLIGHELLNQKSVKKTLIKRFGSKIIGRRGKVDRQALGDEVFNNPADQKWLNLFLHPKIRKSVSIWIKNQEKKTFPLVVVEVPLLFERGYYRRFDGVLSVSAPAELRMKRLLKAGWSKAEITKRESYQWTQAKKNKNADWVIYNHNSIKDLKCCIERWLELITENQKKSAKKN